MTADFVGGASMALSLVVALLFFRYWRESGDRLFAIFAAGFVVFAVSRLMLGFLEEEDEGRTYVYLLRLLAFLLILAAVIDKNRAVRPAASGGSDNGRGPTRSRPSRPPSGSRR